ncbi:glycosyltransferase [Pinibacter soli]|uniref:Glycosyltransferase n=1 Tax=Pinibacter soli TaxID=3044211 RepID=A0ABT6RGG1_9BACT|nr:glycosyltransferase [Pinibacter soli]MDI3321653.1 glycosyltransferase [Pinibacter soli]
MKPIKGLAGVVILYNPDTDVVDNIRSYAPVLEKLWIIDNSEKSHEALVDLQSLPTDVEVLSDGVNRGIGNRINLALKASLQHGFKWLLTMDQDSNFSAANLEAYVAKLNEHAEQDSDIGQIGVQYKRDGQQPDENVVCEPVTLLITSGTFVNVQIAFKVGLMDEDLFIDEVDSDFSYKIALKGFKSLLCKGIYMTHSLGQNIAARSIINWKKTDRFLHVPIRLYYMTRNYLIMRKRYKQYFPADFKKKDVDILHVFKNNLLYNKNKWISLCMIVRGYIDYRRNYVGKLR